VPVEDKDTLARCFAGIRRKALGEKILSPLKVAETQRETEEGESGMSPYL
jgi:hypothetical protein